MAQQYKRILLKLSGESLMGKKQYGIDEVRLQEYAAQIKEIAALGIEIAIVIGGGNIFRGLSGASRGFDRVKGDQMGMLATVINSLALSSALESVGQKARVYTAVPMHPIGEHYSPARAIESLERGEIAIISGGTEIRSLRPIPLRPCGESRSGPMLCLKVRGSTASIRPIPKKILLRRSSIKSLMTKYIIGD